MLDARQVFRKVTRKIFDFSPEQLADLAALVWPYRGQSDRFEALLAQHLSDAVRAAQNCWLDGSGEATCSPLQDFGSAYRELRDLMAAFARTLPEGTEHDLIIVDALNAATHPFDGIEQIRN